MASALARNFDRPAWLFDDAFSDLFVYHAIETLGLRVGANDMTQLGAGFRSAFEASYKNGWVIRRCAETPGLIHKTLLVRDQLGWDPIKKTFRDLAALPMAMTSTSRWDLLQAFFAKLGQNAGMDVWSTIFTADDRALLQARFNPPPVTVVRLADLPATTTAASLATAAWESAVVASGLDRPRRNRLPSDCPLVTGTTPQPVGLYAPAFSQYVFRLGKGWKKLSTGYGLQAGQMMGSAVFVVNGDGKQLFRSPLVRADTPAATSEVDVTGVDRLELLVTDGGDGSAQDLGIWIDPRLGR
jgi:hypothetical protein